MFKRSHFKFIFSYHYLFHPYGHQVVRTCLSVAILNLYFLIIICFSYIFLSLFVSVSLFVLTRTQIDSLLKEELFKEFLKCSNITDQLQSLTKSSDDFIKNTMSYIRSYWFRETVTLCSQ